jgi:hypothetical protein
MINLEDDYAGVPVLACRQLKFTVQCSSLKRKKVPLLMMLPANHNGREG